MKKLRKLLKWLLVAVLFLILILAVTFMVTGAVTKPSNDRNWNDDQDTLPSAVIHDNLVSIHNIRNFKYASTTSYTRAYYDKTFDLNKIKKVWYVVEPFSGFPGSAHTFLSFEFEGSNFVSISIEIRKEKGESFSAWKGLFNQYELMYVVADERDVVKLRSNYRKDLVYVYPIDTGVEKSRALFLDMIKRVNEIKDQPEFYNTVTNTCTTNIVKHVNKVATEKVSWFDLKIFLPASSDKTAYDMKLIDTKLSFEEARKKYFINDRAEKYAEDAEFSVRIRE